MTTANYAPLPRFREFTELGAVAPGALLYTYLSGSATPYPTYTDATSGVQHTNPIEADAGGLFPAIFLELGVAYRFTLTDEDGNPLWGPNDEILAPYTSVNNIDIVATAGEALGAGKAVYLSDGSGGNVAGKWYLADADNAYSANNPYVGMTQLAIANGATGTVRLEGRITGLSGLAAGTKYYVSGTAGSLTSTQGKNRRLMGVADSTTTLVLVPRTTNTAPPAPCNVLDFGAVADGSTDNTTAFQAAVDAATLAGHADVHIPAGVYVLTGTVTMHEGIRLIGVGGQGSDYTQGVTIIHDSTSDCFVWDGNGTSQAGTGGAAKNLLIVKQDAKSGGIAIKIIATDDNHRPGEMQLENVLIYGIGTGLWARGVVIDGSACTTPGSRGVRSVQMLKVRVGDCSTNKKYIDIIAGVHITGTHIQVDQSHGTGTPGMTIGGFSENVNLGGLIINGTLELAATVGDLFHCTFMGCVTTFTQGNSDAVGVAVISSGTFTNNSSFFKILASNNASFLGVRTTPQTDVTGDGTVVTVVYDSEQHDQNGDFDPTTGKFTARVKGAFTFQAAVAFHDCGDAHIRYDAYFLHRDSGGSGLFLYDFAVGNPSSEPTMQAGMQASGGNVTMSGAITIRLSEGETVEVQAAVAGGGKTVDINGDNATVIYTWFSGHQLP